MKVLLLTVAGTFYEIRKIAWTGMFEMYLQRKRVSMRVLLGNMVRKDASFDKIVIVGGYKFKELKDAVENHFPI